MQQNLRIPVEVLVELLIRVDASSSGSSWETITNGVALPTMMRSRSSRLYRWALADAHTQTLGEQRAEVEPDAAHDLLHRDAGADVTASASKRLARSRQSGSLSTTNTRNAPRRVQHEPARRRPPQAREQRRGALCLAASPGNLSRWVCTRALVSPCHRPYRGSHGETEPSDRPLRTVRPVELRPSPGRSRSARSPPSLAGTATPHRADVPALSVLPVNPSTAMKSNRQEPHPHLNFQCSPNSPR